MKPLCYKRYFYKIIEIIIFILVSILNLFFWLNRDESRYVYTFACILSILLLFILINIIYWIFQPHILIYHYETGVIIKRKTKFEYKDIERVYHRNYIHKDGKYGSYYRNQYIGTIYIILKSGKKYRILNAADPIKSIDFLLKIKKQRKFR